MIAEPDAPPTSSATQRPPFWRALGLFVAAVVAGFVAIAIASAFEFGFGVSQKAFANATGAPLQGALIVFELTVAAIVLWRLPAITKTPLRELGLRLPHGADWRAFGYGILALIGLRIVLVVQLALQHQENHRQAGFEKLQAGGPLDTALIVLALVVVAPFAEELLFRMTLFRTLAQRLPLWLAVAISSCVFAAFHMDAVLFLTLALFGAVLALCYRSTNCIVVSMLLHACNNGLGALGLLYLSAHPGK